MKILIIGSEKSKESQQLKREAEKRGHQLEIIPLNRLIFKIGKSLSVLSNNNRDIAEFEAVLFRAINRHVIEAKIIARYLKEKGKIAVDEILAGDDYEYHKFSMHARLKEKNIPQPATYFPLGFSGLKKVLEKIKPPLMVKHIKEMRGRRVFRFDSQKQVLDFFTPHLSRIPQTLRDKNIKPLKGAGFSQNKKQRLGRYLIQEWYPEKSYYRVLVLGKQVLGVMERLSLLSKKRPSIPLAKRSKQTILTPALKKIALEAAKALGMELAGLDIMPDKKGRLRVLEINRSPRFKRFSQVTGINVAEKVIEYIERKVLGTRSPNNPK